MNLNQKTWSKKKGSERERDKIKRVFFSLNSDNKPMSRLVSLSEYISIIVIISINSLHIYPLRQQLKTVASKNQKE